MATDMALRDAIAFEFFDDTPDDKHGQLCPIWTQRGKPRGREWTNCDCWQLPRCLHLADLALGTPALRARLTAKDAEPGPGPGRNIDMWREGQS